MTRYILSPSPTWTEGFLVGRFPGSLSSGEHLSRDECDKVTRGDAVYIIGGWETGMTRAERVAVEKVLHDSRALILNGAGNHYDWGDPKPWEYEETQT